MYGLFHKIITNSAKCNLFIQKESPQIIAYIIRSFEIRFSEIELNNLANRFGKNKQDFIDYYKAPVAFIITKKKFLTFWSLQ